MARNDLTPGHRCVYADLVFTPEDFFAREALYFSVEGKGGTFGFVSFDLK